MKKILVMLAVAASVTACNSNSESTETKDTSATTTTVTGDTTHSTVTNALVDSNAVKPADSTAVAPLVDTTKK